MSAQTTRGSDRQATVAHARVEDVMHSGIIGCQPDTDIVTVARTMVTHHIHSIVVDDVEGADHGWGMLSDLDLVASALPGVANADAGGLATTEVITVDADEPLERAAQLMVEHQLAHLLVLSPSTGRPVGIVSTLDVARALAWGEG